MGKCGCADRAWGRDGWRGRNTPAFPKVESRDASYHDYLRKVAPERGKETHEVIERNSDFCIQLERGVKFKNDVNRVLSSLDSLHLHQYNEYYRLMACLGTREGIYPQPGARAAGNMPGNSRLHVQPTFEKRRQEHGVRTGQSQRRNESRQF